jgi:hypothetical protein
MAVFVGASAFSKSAASSLTPWSPGQGENRRPLRRFADEAHQVFRLEVRLGDFVPLPNEAERAPEVTAVQRRLHECEKLTNGIRFVVRETCCCSHDSPPAFSTHRQPNDMLIDSFLSAEILMP